MRPARFAELHRQRAGDAAQYPSTPNPPSNLEPGLPLLIGTSTGGRSRLMEDLRLPVKVVDFARGVVVVRWARGDRNRVVMLPRSLAGELRQTGAYCARAVGSTAAGAVRRRERFTCTGDQIPGMGHSG